MKDELRAIIHQGATAMRLLHYPDRATVLDTVPDYIEKLEAAARAAIAFVGPVPLELLARRDAGEHAIGIAAGIEWVQLLEALRDVKPELDAE